MDRTPVVAIGCLLALSMTMRAQPPAPGTSAQPAPPAKAPDAQPVGTMSELMVQVIYPTSDAVFYVSSRTPTTDAEWAEFTAKTLILAESANMLMMPARARGRAQWLADAKLLLDAGRDAFGAAKKRDVTALEDLSDRLLLSCTQCHEHFRPNYRKRGH